MAPASALVALAALTVAVVGCGGDDDGPADVALSDDAQITYHFGDASVPPQYHRSYTLTIDAHQVHAVVDSYGDVVGETTEDLPAGVWDGLVAGAGTVAGLNADTGDDGGCSGGTSREVEVVDGGETVVHTGFPVCGGANGGAADALDAYVQPVLDAIPDWDELTATS